MEARERAIRWKDGKSVPDRYDGIDLSRVEERKLILTRRITNEPTPIPRYELEIPASRGPAEPWMRIYIGTINTIDQSRVDEAVATLQERLHRYRARVAKKGRKLAGKGLENVAVAATQEPRRLECADVIAWTGRGIGITFNPPATVDVTRQSAFLPELEAYVQERLAERLGDMGPAILEEALL